MGLEGLPDSVMERIFDLTPYPEDDQKLGRDALPFVCRHFNHIYRSSKLLWGTMELTVDGSASQEGVTRLLASLPHKGEAVERLWLHLHNDKVALAEVMAYFSPEGLRELELKLCEGHDASHVPASQLRCLGRFTRLRKLNVYCVPSSPLQGGNSSLQWLCGLRELQALSLIANFHDAVVFTSISRLTALSSLQLYPADAQLSSMLTCLSRLQKLDLQLKCDRPQQLGAACFSHLQQLSQLDIRSIHSGGAGAGARQPLQLEGLSTMPRLQRLTLRWSIAFDLQDLLRCSQLRRLELLSVPQPFAALEGGRLPCGSLPSLVSLLWQPEFEDNDGAEAGVTFPEALCQLTQLQELAAINETHRRLQLSLPAAFSQLRGLQRLQISCLGLQEVPAAITGLSKLEFLEVSRNSLSAESFPPGPYLANLRLLILHANNLQRIPEVLASATKLEALDVSENLPYQFSADQLTLLPNLKRLYITKRLMYCSPQLQEFGSAAEMLKILWSTDTLREAFQVHSRFPKLKVMADRYMADEQWCKREWIRF